MSLSEYPPSPTWSSTGKRLVFIFLVILLLLLVYRVRNLLLPFILAMILAYLVQPLVKQISRVTRLPRTLTIVLLYLVIIAALIAIPASTIPPVIGQVNTLITNIPTYIQQVSALLSDIQEPIYITDEIIIPLDQLPLDQAILSISGNLLNIVQGFGGQTISIFGSVLGASLNTVGWVVLILFLSFYMIKDHEQIFNALVQLAPKNYEGDVRHLSYEIGALWNAFLRGQLVLCIVVGLIVFCVAVLLGLPNALLLALIAGLMEFLPTIGPVLAAIPAAFLGYFQADSSWLGQLIGPFWFVLVIILIYVVIYQMENYYLLPRIIGYRLNLHPIVVVLGAIAGASVAGILGIILAAPTLATGRILFVYVHAKLTDRPLFLDANPLANESEAVQNGGDNASPQ
jgi:predicted PurR-regulated permease PerM